MSVKTDISVYQKLAAERGGKLLSTEYIDNKTKMEWVCAKSHRWLARPADIGQGKWCLICSGRAPHNLAWCNELAREHNGFCLSAEYKNTQTHMEWECEQGHRWSAVPYGVQQGKWCPYCAGHDRKDIEYLQGLAAKHGGVCLATEYKTALSRYQWRCSKSHEWTAIAGNIQQGYWCPYCAGVVPNDLAFLKDLAAKKSGLCLSTEYINNRTKYQWQCARLHEWAATAKDVERGRWCPACSGKRSNKELSVLAYVKTVFPDAIGSQRGLLKDRRFELDIYVPSLKKAIEFDGKFWHESEWARSHGSAERDARKSAQCIEAGIALLRIPERNFDTDQTAIFTLIKDFLM